MVVLTWQVQPCRLNLRVYPADRQWCCTAAAQSLEERLRALQGFLREYCERRRQRAQRTPPAYSGASDMRCARSHPEPFEP